MKRIKKLLADERGDATMVEALIIYPSVFIVIFLIIYIGLYILQSITVGTYAQKVAMLVSREISSPGYYNLIDGKEYSDSAIELSSSIENISVDVSKMSQEMMRFPVVYRYWQIGDNKILNDKSKEYYHDILESMLTNNSIIAPEQGGKLDIKISCKNNVVSQLVTVEVEQELVHMEFLERIGVEPPKVSASAVSTVSDTDELVRNTDFAVDAMEALASKLGIDTTKLKDTVNNALKKLGLI